MASRVGTAEGAEILHLSVAPAEGMKGLITRQVGISDHFAAVICALAETRGAAKIAQIRHGAVVPEEWVMVGCPELAFGVKLM